jgi:hypothetical protein
MDIEMFGQLLPEQANASDSATTYVFAGLATGALPPLLSHQLINEPLAQHLLKVCKNPCQNHLKKYNRPRRINRCNRL